MLKRKSNVLGKNQHLMIGGLLLAGIISLNSLFNGAVQNDYKNKTSKNTKENTEYVDSDSCAFLTSKFQEYSNGNKILRIYFNEQLCQEGELVYALDLDSTYSSTNALQILNNEFDTLMMKKRGILEVSLEN